jgi:serine/threonine-protein kinase
MTDHAGAGPAGPGQAASPTPEGDLTGKVLGDFRLLRRLGEGGMGQVYLGEQVSLRRKVAVKILRAELAANETSLRRFKVEAEAVARFSHANIVQVYAFGESGGIHYMALEYVDGRNLRDYLAKKGPPDALLALSIMRQVAAALQRAHEHAIIHRDIKPENILLTRKGEVKVADFGLSRCLAGDQPALHLTQSGVSMGTPLYMSPEQVQGKAVDARTDIYSFGVTCYHMLAGQPPFRGETAFEVALQHVQSQAVSLGQVRPDLPPELGALVDRMMAKDPDQRYQCGRDLLKDLTRLRESLSGASGVTPSPTVPVGQAELFDFPSGPTPSQVSHRTTAAYRRPRRTGWLPWLAAGTVVLALVGGAGAGLIASDPLGWFHRAAPSEVAPSQPGAGLATAVSPELQELEQRLVEAARKHPNPEMPHQRNERPVQLIAGLNPRVELGLFYLDQSRLDDAGRYFQELIDNPYKVPAYRTLGELGQGIVLAQRDRPKESYRLFEAARSRPQFFSLLLRLFPRLAEKTSRALQRNVDNKEEIPPALKPLLEFPPNPRWFGAGKPGKP